MQRRRGRSGIFATVIAAALVLTIWGFAAAGARSTSSGVQSVPKGSPAEQSQPSSDAPAGAILCRVLEVKTASNEHVDIALFHQARREDGERLGELLRSRDGATGKFETPNGKWHSATLLRLGDCFGRGLLVFSARAASLVQREEIWLKIPVETGSLGSRAR